MRSTSRKQEISFNTIQAIQYCFVHSERSFARSGQYIVKITPCSDNNGSATRRAQFKFQQKNSASSQNQTRTLDYFPFFNGEEQLRCLQLQSYLSISTFFKLNKLCNCILFCLFLRIPNILVFSKTVQTYYQRNAYFYNFLFTHLEFLSLQLIVLAQFMIE